MELAYLFILFNVDIYAFYVSLYRWFRGANWDLSTSMSYFMQRFVFDKAPVKMDDDSSSANMYPLI